MQNFQIVSLIDIKPLINISHINDQISVLPRYEPPNPPALPEEFSNPPTLSKDASPVDTVYLASAQQASGSLTILTPSCYKYLPLDLWQPQAWDISLLKPYNEKCRFQVGYTLPTADVLPKKRPAIS